MSENLTISEIKEICSCATEKDQEEIHTRFDGDPRSGVASALRSMDRRIEKEAAEEQRLRGMYGFEDAIRHSRGKEAGCFVVGLDEVGRGPLAGPCAIGAVVLDSRPDSYVIKGLNDSKKLTGKHRREISSDVKERALAWSIQYSDAAEIDELGIAACLRDCFCRGIAECERQLREKGIEGDIEIVLLDGNPLHLDPREVNVIKGDAQCASIAAASIIAKEDRDALMVELDSQYPEYDFAGHKGYGSADHIAAIKEHGLSPVHRKSFCKSFCG